MDVRKWPWWAQCYCCWLEMMKTIKVQKTQILINKNEPLNQIDNGDVLVLHGHFDHSCSICMSELTTLKNIFHCASFSTMITAKVRVLVCVFLNDGDRGLQRSIWPCLEKGLFCLKWPDGEMQPWKQSQVLRGKPTGNVGQHKSSTILRKAARKIHNDWYIPYWGFSPILNMFPAPSLVPSF